jgi:hypothetical protein
MFVSVNCRNFSSLLLEPVLHFPMMREIGNQESNYRSHPKKADRMLRIRRSANGHVVFTLSGRMDEEDIAELETLIKSEAKGRRMVLDLRDLILAGRDAVSFLERCEADGITLKNCAAYVREWITRQRCGS